MTSPTDFNFALIKEDRPFLEKRGWQVKWCEFEGGHRSAPEGLYAEALAWILTRAPFTRQP